MGVYIKGMEMPETCYECPLGDNEFYECRAINGRRMKYHHDEYGYPDGERQDWCPLIPIPPDGRLIIERDVPDLWWLKIPPTIIEEGEDDNGQNKKID